jgi:hypothetical protein
MVGSTFARGILESGGGWPSHRRYFLISIHGYTQTYFIYPQWNLPTTQKKKKRFCCCAGDGSAYQYGPLSERVVDMLRVPDGRAGVCNRAGAAG